MSKITLALGSFAVGLLLGSLFFNIHTVTLAQTSAPPTGPSLPIGIKLAKEPVVPGLGPPFVNARLNGPSLQPLDGLNCEDCDFSDAVLRYSGGAVRLVNPKFSGTIRVELSGAAANTVMLLPLLTALSTGKPPEPVNPNKPILKVVKMETAVTIHEWTSPYQK